MFNYESVIDTIRHIELESEAIWVIMGAALVMHGVKCECADIDLGASRDFAESLQRAGYERQRTASGLVKVAICPDVSLYGGWPQGDLVHLAGIRVASLSSVRSDKLRLGRPKDMADVVLIDDHLAGQ